MASRKRSSLPGKASGKTPCRHLFVYGTLMRGHRLHPHLARPGVHYVGRGRIRAGLYQLRDRGYPAAVPAGDRDRFVHGELYLLDFPEVTLRRLDRIEGVDEGLYAREQVDVWTNGSKTTAWSYFFKKPLKRAVPLPSGRFRKTKTAITR